MSATTPRRRTFTLFAVIVATFAGLLVSPPAQAATLDDATGALGITGPYQLVRIGHTGDVTSELAGATKSAATAELPRVVALPAGNLQINAQIRLASHVYLVAEPSTTVVLTGAAGQMLWFNDVTGGVYGGSWDASRKSDGVVGVKASDVRLAQLTVRNAAKNGIAAYAKSTLTLTGITSTGNVNDGVYADASTVSANHVQATRNRRNGIQLSAGTVGTIVDSILDGNGLAVTGSTTGKTGHGLGVASARAVVTRTSMSSNKVCGASLTGAVDVALNQVTLSGNGRHGLGSTPGVRASLSDSVVTGNGYNGVLASGSGTKLRLTGVTIAGSAQYGLSVPSKGSATVQKTTIATSGRSNVSVSVKSTLTVEDGNTIADGRADGITVTEGARFNVSGDGNRVAANKGNGLVISGKGTAGRITRSVLFDTNRKHGILVKTKAALATVTNSFARNKGATIHKQSGGKVTKLT